MANSVADYSPISKCPQQDGKQTSYLVRQARRANFPPLPLRIFAEANPDAAVQQSPFSGPKSPIEGRTIKQTVLQRRHICRRSQQSYGDNGVDGMLTGTLGQGRNSRRKGIPLRRRFLGRQGRRE
jgi:hypothetical protein